MNKGLFERFISKYNLAGAAESVILESSKNSLKTKFITDDKNAVGFVGTTKIDMDSGEFAVYDTTKLRSLLNVLDEDISIKVNKKTDGSPTNFVLSDGSTKATFVLADKQNIPVAPNMKNIPEFDVSIALDQKFLNTFIKAKGALAEVDTFTIVSNKNKTDVVLGYSELNTNRVSINVTSEIANEIEPISFSAGYFRDILMANKEMDSGTLRVSSKGLAHISFEIKDFSVDYYLVKINQ